MGRRSPGASHRLRKGWWRVPAAPPRTRRRAHRPTAHLRYLHLCRPQPSLLSCSLSSTPPSPVNRGPRRHLTTRPECCGSRDTQTPLSSRIRSDVARSGFCSAVSTRLVRRPTPRTSRTRTTHVEARNGLTTTTRALCSFSCTLSAYAPPSRARHCLRWFRAPARLHLRL